ncbi:trypsin-2-like [Contarinia nasturtii]|uniref:trypsin-2-like n=1 Tax=Contarinia nasturtii TaxID=265458 RepID=UPI0012D3B341|nr:trypsin-2-like [Contarinia nasturtii]
MKSISIVVVLVFVFIKSGVCQLRIVNGKEADIRNHPWQVAINRVSWSFFHDHVCGGVIIGTRFILTAGHCMNDTTNLIVRAGSTSSTWWGSKFDIANVMIHNEYPRNPLMDIAIITLEQEIEYSDSMRAIKMLSANYIVSAGRPATISGYGRTGLNDSLSKVLMEATLQTISLQDCQSFDPYVDESVQCAIDRSPVRATTMVQIVMLLYPLFVRQFRTSGTGLNTTLGFNAYNL